jgi:AraC family transcriptional regulator
MNDWVARMENALAVLAGRLNDPPSLEELANAANVSPFHFHRIWRAMTGETVARTIARLRIASAQQRLVEPDASVTSVAMDTGFGTSQSFARAFRRVAGMSPTEFLSNGTARITVATADDAPLRIEFRERGELVTLRKEGGAYRELNELFWRLWTWAEGADKLDDLQGIYGIPLDDPVSIDEHHLRYDACLAFTDPGTPPVEFGRITLPAGDHAVLLAAATPPAPRFVVTAMFEAFSRRTGRNNASWCGTPATGASSSWHGFRTASRNRANPATA